MSRSKTIRVISVTSPSCNQIRVEVDYREGGWNYFTGSMVKRGYYLSVSPLRVEGRTRTYNGFTGYSRLLEEAKRYSEKKLYSVTAPEEMVDRIVDRVLREQKAETA